MAIVTFTSLKGGVGKTSAAINVAHALARRGCETVLVDLDPSAHTTRFFSRQRGLEIPDPKWLLQFRSTDSKLAFQPAGINTVEQGGAEIEHVVQESLEIDVREVRRGLSLLPGSHQLRQVVQRAVAAQSRSYVAGLLHELGVAFDYVVVDTAPEYSWMLEAALGCSDLAIVPVDASAMSIDALDELLGYSAKSAAASTAQPGSGGAPGAWCVLRTMVARQAARVNRLAAARLESSIDKTGSEVPVDEFEHSCGCESADEFLAMVAAHDQRKGADIYGERDLHSERDLSNESAGGPEKPVYLLEVVIHRTEQQNALSHRGRTAFDIRATKRLASEYALAAKEIEHVLSLYEQEENVAFPMEGFLESVGIG